MRYTNVYLGALGYELPPLVVTSEDIEADLESLYRKLHLPQGQIESLTGIAERRWWRPGFRLSDGAIAAGRKALAAANVDPGEVGALVYTGVCREGFEPATACRVAAELGVGGEAAVYDISNACLGVLNGILDLANRIELGQIRTGLVVSCESAREINEETIAKVLAAGTMDAYKEALATFTGGSGAVAVLLTDGSSGSDRRQLLGGVAHAAPEHNDLCRWDLEDLGEGLRRQYMSTDAVAVLKNGVALGKRTWESLLSTLGWQGDTVDRVVCHQVGQANRDAILSATGISRDKDFASYPFLGNIGTVSLPLTAALAEERGILQSGNHVAFLGIGSGLNCMMLGLKW